MTGVEYAVNYFPLLYCIVSFSIYIPKHTPPPVRAFVEVVRMTRSVAELQACLGVAAVMYNPHHLKLLLSKHSADQAGPEVCVCVCVYVHVCVCVLHVYIQVCVRAWYVW